MVFVTGKKSKAEFFLFIYISEPGHIKFVLLHVFCISAILHSSNQNS